MSVCFPALPQAHDLPADASAFAPTGDPLWMMIDNEFTPLREHEFESLFSVSNGYLGNRSSISFGTPMASSTLFIAGVFDAASPFGLPELVALPVWRMLSQGIGSDPIAVEKLAIKEHRRMLDMRQGMFRRMLRFSDDDGRIARINYLRLASLADRHLLLQSMLYVPENYSGPAKVRSGFLTPEVLTGELGFSRATGRDTPFGPVLEIEGRTHAGMVIAFAAAVRLSLAFPALLEPKAKRTIGNMDELMEWEAEAGKTYRVDWLQTCYTSRDTGHPAQAALAHLEKLLQEGARPALERHIVAWSRRWQTADAVIEGDEQAQRAIRFACYHLISAANPEDEHVSIGAKALTGPVYKGHVFWDTEIFLLPFYALTDPAAARALLMYRFHTLAQARERARKYGCKGALYAWESADTGADVTPPYSITPVGEVVAVLTGAQAHHISADVAYAVWQYWQSSGDDEFLCNAGGEILIETARFWASRGEIEDDGFYHIRKVIGPDEYHESVDDNAYTNWMAQWNLECACAVVRMFEERWPQHWDWLMQRIRLGAEEAERWRAIAGRMYTGIHPGSDVIEQFQGYFDLREIDLAQFAPRSLPIDVILGRERTQGGKIIKQADVLMLLYLLWERIPAAVREACFRYYEPRTEHGSSLSPAIHALLAARLGDEEMALRYFRQAREIDLADNMGNAFGGVHIAALGGIWQALVLGFAGLRIGEEGLVFMPHCPAGWRSIGFPLLWRGCRLQAKIEPATLEIDAIDGAALPVSVGSTEKILLEPGWKSRWEQHQGEWKEVAREPR